MLSSLSREKLDEYIKCGKLRRYTRNTIVRPAQLNDELDKVRKQGFAFDWEEVGEGAVCVAAPVRKNNGNIIAALSISAPKMRVNQRRKTFLRDLVVKYAKAISNKLDGDIML